MNYVIYALKDPRTDQIRYVGKSVNGLRRYQEHMKPCNLKAKSHKVHWIKELKSKNLIPIVEILESAKTKEELTELEIKWIAKCLADGCPLTNGTLGGEGAPGRVVSDETKEKMRRARLAHYSDKSKRTPPVNKKSYKEIDKIPHKQCSSCLEFKMLTEFGSYRSRWDGLHCRCKICHAADVQKRRGRLAPNEN